MAGRRLKPRLIDFNIKLLTYDHNWDHPEYAEAVLGTRHRLSFMAYLRGAAVLLGCSVWWRRCGGQ